FGNGVGAGIVMTLAADAAPIEGRIGFLSVWRTMSDTGGAAGPLLVSIVATAWPPRRDVRANAALNGLRSVPLKSGHGFLDPAGVEQVPKLLPYAIRRWGPGRRCRRHGPP